MHQSIRADSLQNLACRDTHRLGARIPLLPWLAPPGGLPAVLAGLVDADELHVEEQRLINELGVLQDKVERTLRCRGARRALVTSIERSQLSWTGY